MASFGLVALLIAAAAAPAAGAAGTPSTGDRLRAAKARLHELERAIASRSDSLDAVQAHLLTVLARVDAARAKQATIQGQLVDLDIRFRDTQASFVAIQARLDARAVNAFMFGPAEGIEMVLGASSVGDLADRVGFVDALQTADAELGRRTATAAKSLDGFRATKSTLLHSQDAVVHGLEADEQDVTATFATEQAALDGLSSVRVQLLSAVSALQTKLDREEQAALGRADRGSSMTAFDAWSKLLLGRLGDDACTNDRILIVAWETAEFTKAAWNPLATTHDMNGATRFNSAGVKNYVSLDQGLRATVDTLRGGKPSYGYGPILDGLARCDAPMTTALAVNASAWCHGCAGGRYVLDVVPAIEAWFQQQGIG